MKPRYFTAEIFHLSPHFPFFLFNSQNPHLNPSSMTTIINILAEFLSCWLVMALTQANSIYGPICCCLHSCLHRCLPHRLTPRCLSWPTVTETLEGITPEVSHQMRLMHVGQRGQGQCGSPTLMLDYSCLYFVLVVSAPFNCDFCWCQFSRSYLGVTDEVW